MKGKTKAKIVLGVVVVVAIAVVAVKTQEEIRRRKEIAEGALTNIQTELDALDPVSRAAVVAKLSADEVNRTRGRG
jgi:hypothetical protein